MMLARYAVRGLLVPAWMLAATGCGSEIEDVCSTLCDCEPCTDREYDECVEDGEAVQDRAEEHGCDSHFDAWIGCVNDHVSCEQGSEKDTCKKEEEAVERCLDPHD